VTSYSLITLLRELEKSLTAFKDIKLVFGLDCTCIWERPTVKKSARIRLSTNDRLIRLSLKGPYPEAKYERGEAEKLIQCQQPKIFARWAGEIPFANWVHDKQLVRHGAEASKFRSDSALWEKDSDLIHWRILQARQKIDKQPAARFYKSRANPI